MRHVELSCKLYSLQPRSLQWFLAELISLLRAPKLSEGYTTDGRSPTDKVIVGRSPIMKVNQNFDHKMTVPAQRAFYSDRRRS